MEPSVFREGKKLPHVFSLAKTPTNLNTLSHKLKGYDPEGTIAIFNGLAYGLTLYYSCKHEPNDAKNLKSAGLHPDIVRQKIQMEVEAGRVTGPFANRPLPNTCISPLGLVQKKEPGQF